MSGATAVPLARREGRLRSLTVLALLAFALSAVAATGASAALMHAAGCWSGEPPRIGFGAAACRPLETAGAAAAGAAGGAAAYPLPQPAPITDGVGPRECRVSGAGGCASSLWHPALDFGAACGVPVLAVRPGVVAEHLGYWLTILGDDGAQTSYLHMESADVLVVVGERVAAGQVIGAVGTAGPSTGCHLDLRVNTLGSQDEAVSSLPHVGDASVGPGWVDPTAYMALYGVDLLVGGTA